ncbi:fungal specific transcription factor domain-containing protein [Apiospora arundinis]
MSDSPQSQSEMGADAPRSSTLRTRPRPPLNRRRDKPQLSCNLCRRRKLRCDRCTPCGTCSSRNLQCTYANAPRSDRGRHDDDASTSSPYNGIQNRVSQLESLIGDLMHRGAKDTRPSRPSPSPNTTTTSGRDVVAQSTSGVGAAPRDLDSGSLSLQSSTWVNSNHWSVLVDGISDGRASQPASSDTPVGSDNSAPPSSPGPKLFYSCPPATRAEIIAALPPRRTSDRLVSSFFNFLDTAAAAIVHSREFLIMYKRLWNDPPSVPITWISILFSVFCIATRFQHAMEFHKDHSIKVKGKLSTETTSNYREKAVQALMLGQYTKGGPYVIEALLLYFTSEHFTNIDAQIESWLILSVTVNIAMRQGYHRDPRHFPQLSPYQGEMRRRVWATLYQVDLSISVQMGLPKLIRDNVSDTQLPGNYAENDFDPSTTQLPMPRPDTEMTPLLYTISKTRLVRVIGMIMEHVTEVQTPSYEDVIRIDAMLDEVYANMPEVFRWEGISESILSSTAIVSQKFFLYSIHQKGKLLLHRKYIPSQGQQEEPGKYEYSRKTALEAGLSILRLHHLVVEESKPSGQLYSFQFLFNSLVSHDLFAGALAVCFYLQHHRNSMDPGKLQETKSLLRKSQGLWIEASPTSVEAGKAAEALRIFLNRLDEETLAKQNTEDILSPSELFTSELMPCDVFQDSFWDIRLPFTYFPMDLPGPRPEEPVFLMLDGGQDVGTTESWLASV